MKLSKKKIGENEHNVPEVQYFATNGRGTYTLLTKAEVEKRKHEIICEFGDPLCEEKIEKRMKSMLTK